VFLLGILACLTGCMTLDFSVKNTAVPVLLNAPSEKEYVVVEHFSVLQDRSMLFLKRLHGGGHPDIQGMLDKQLKKTPGDAIINLTITGETREMDVVGPLIFGIAGAFVFTPLVIIAFEPMYADLKSYSIEGDVIRYTKKENRIPIDPETGMPVQTPAPGEFDPETGLPKK
jgi:hypothetical protein